MPRRIAAVVPDLMDRSRLSGAPDVVLRFVGVGAIADLDAADTDLLVVDLTRPGVLDTLAMVPVGVDVVGFGPHVDDELLAAATAAGCDRVLPRSRFFSRWPEV